MKEWKKSRAGLFKYAGKKARNRESWIHRQLKEGKKLSNRSSVKSRAGEEKKRIECKRTGKERKRKTERVRKEK